MVHKKEEGACHRIEKIMKEIPGFLSPKERSLPLLLIPEYSRINKEQKISWQIQNSTQMLLNASWQCHIWQVTDWRSFYYDKWTDFISCSYFIQYDILGDVAANGLISFLMAE